MCQNCIKLKKQIEEEKQYKIGNYEAYQSLKKKFERFTVAYRYLPDMQDVLD